ncbi:MAG TPA: DUF1653 domain-containing protein [Candidatus Acidoferrum sp.]|nr:DUF1653 domain-containing protein [Candidatus Acidoferrum sp.]
MPAHRSEAELLQEINAAKQKVTVGGIYAHYKGPDKLYKVLDIAYDTEAEAVCVVYQAQYGKQITYTRPLQIWLQSAELDGRLVKRFTLQPEPAKSYIDKLAFIYVKDQRVLETLSRGKDTWYIPGGKREPGESDIDALTREVKEELSVDLLPGTIKPYGSFETQAHGKSEGTMVRMTCYTADFVGNLRPASEIAEIDFFDYAQKHRTSPVDHLVFDDLQRKGLLK